MRTLGSLLLGFALTATIAASAGCGGKASGTGGTGGTGAATASTSTGAGAGAGRERGGRAARGPRSSSSGTGGAGAGGGVAKFPDTTSSIALLVDQLPNGMTAAQQQFVATHFVGTEKLTLSTRARSARSTRTSSSSTTTWRCGNRRRVDFIVDGKTWGNDYPTVTTHETWFWHDASSSTSRA